MKPLFKQVGVFVVAFGIGWLAAGLVAGLISGLEPIAGFAPHLKSLLAWAAFWAACIIVNAYRVALANRAEISPVSTPGFEVYKAAAAVDLLVIVAGWIAFREEPALVGSLWIFLLEMGTAFSIAHGLKYAQLELTRPHRVFGRK
jgi:hypothetical protein